uniref:Flagellar export protein FliJ n=1 Tax=Hirondellea gigas TaxID=1518452 RepID=A0A6A7G1N2_9CRUS
MNMAKNVLKLVYEQKQKQVTSALQAYKKAQNILFEQRQQLQNLQQYRRQYTEQLSVKGALGLSVSELRKYQQFIVQIDLGLSKQQQMLVKLEYDVHAYKKSWLECQINSKAIAMLLHKKALKEEKIENIKEQKLLDEFTIFQYFQKRSQI